MSKVRVQSAPNLKQIQDWMKWAIVEPQGIEDALKSPFCLVATASEKAKKRLLENSPRHLDWIDSTKDLSNVSRLSIYAEGYFSRLLDAVVADFPLTQAAMGEENLSILVADYIVENPSRYCSLADFGLNLSQFLDGHPFVIEFPFLLELVAFETLQIKIFYHPKFHNSLSQKQVLMLEKDSESLKFSLNPTARIVSLDWNIAEGFGSRVMDQWVPQKLLEQKKYVFFRDTEGSIELFEFSDFEIQLFDLFNRGMKLGECVEILVLSFSTERLELFFGQTLQRWTAAGLIVDVD